MNRGFFLVIVIAAAISGAGQEKESDLAWLSGCWEMKSESRGLQITEVWMKPAGGTMVGAGRTIKNGKAVDYEFLRIVEEADGIFYIAKPTANKHETKFKLTRASAGELVFENPAHDFPQRIIYKRSGNRLNARVEGTVDGKARGIDFPYARISCE